MGALVRGAALTPSSRVVEVGCGAGDYAVALHRETGASCWGVDPSEAMLAVARRRSAPPRFVRRTAERLPFVDGEVDFVFAVDVVHHLQDLAAALSEARRVLRPSGRLCVVTEDEAAIRGRLHAECFPEIVAVELARYPPLGALRAALAAAGLSGVAEERVESRHAVTDPEPYRARVFSSLRLLPANAYSRGLERLERALAGGPIPATSRRVLVWASAPA